jgi:hypothetical protein
MVALPFTSVDALIARLLRGDRPPASDLAAHEAGLLLAAQRHEVVALVAESLARCAGASAGLRSTFERAMQQLAAADLAAEAELQRVLAGFVSKRVEALIIKGSHLAYSHYARSDLRHRIDSDLLVDRSQRDIADAALIESGYTADPKVSGDFTATQRLYAKRRFGAVVHIVDLHWRLASPQVFAHVLSYEELSSASAPIPALGSSARGPSNVHALLIACMHRVAHHHDEGERLKWVFDIHLIASRFDERSWAAFATLAVERGIAAVCLEGLECATQWLDTRVPNWLVADERFRSAASREQTSAYLTARPPARAVLDDFKALPTWRDRARLAREHFFPGTTYMRSVYAPSSRLPVAALYALRIVRGAGTWLRHPGEEKGAVDQR